MKNPYGRVGLRPPHHILASAGLALVMLLAGGCARTHSNIAVVNIALLEQNWPKFINYYNQLQANFIAIRDSKLPEREKARARAQFREQERRWQNEVAGDVRAAAREIADRRHYQLILTKQGVAYGGDDITQDVMKSLKIPLPSPSPGP